MNQVLETGVKRVASLLSLAHVAAISVASAVAVTRAQAPAVSVDTLVARALRYVEAYEKAFSAVVCEERQKQCLVRPKEKVETHRDLRFDFLRVKKEEIRIPK